MHPRVVPLAGPANFRDLGGYETVDGHTVRTGRLFRSDSLSHMTTEDVVHVVEVLGIHTVVDLRAGDEVDQFSHGPLQDEGVVFHHVPIIDDTRNPGPGFGDTPDVAEWTLERIYLLMLDRFADRFGRVVSLVAEPDRHPTVFHCAAGKDRTGLVAALVLSLLGVDDDVIAADYAITAEVLPLMVERHRAREAAGLPGEVTEARLSADADAMRAVLARLRADHGSIEQYIQHAGVPPSAVRALRESLLAAP